MPAALPASRPGGPTGLARLVLVVSMAFPAAGATASLAAQDPVAAETGEWWTGASVGLPGAGRTPFFQGFTLGMHFTRVPVRQVGVDLSIGTAPYTVTLGALSLGARGGLTVPLRAGSGLFLPSAGLSWIGVFHGGAENVTGYHVGAATVRESGLRFGLTLHWVGDEPAPIWLLELGFLRPRGREP